MNQSNLFCMMSSLFILTWLSIGCNPTYQSIRAYVPQHNDAKQLQVEVGQSQADVSYSITDQISVNAGAVYLTSETDITQTVNDVEITSKETSNLTGGHIGAAYFKAFGASKKNVVSVNVGSAFQSWDYNQTNPDATLGTGFTSFEASVINPYAQLGYSYGSQMSNIVLGLRYEKPMFDFQKVQPNSLTDESNPSLVNVIIQGKFNVVGPISFFTQYIHRTNLDGEYYFDTLDYTNPYSISSWNLYVGLSYAMGFEDPKKEIIKGSSDTKENVKDKK